MKRLILVLLFALVGPTWAASSIPDSLSLGTSGTTSATQLVRLSISTSSTYTAIVVRGGTAQAIDYLNFINATGLSVFSCNSAGQIANALGFGWEDAVFSAQIDPTNVSAPDVGVIDGTGVQIALFDGNATSEWESFAFEVPHSAKLGAPIYPHVHWSSTTTATGTVRWGLEYLLHAQVGTMTSCATIYVTQDTTATAWYDQRADFAAITPAALLGQTINCRLFRKPNDAEDTYPDDAALCNFGIHYLIDSVGSRGIGTK